MPPCRHTATKSPVSKKMPHCRLSDSSAKFRHVSAHGDSPSIPSTGEPSAKASLWPPGSFCRVRWRACTSNWNSSTLTCSMNSGCGRGSLSRLSVETLHEIAEHVEHNSKADLASLVRVDQRFQALGEGILWRELPSIVPLLRLLMPEYFYLNYVYVVSTMAPPLDYNHLIYCLAR